jgi:pyruvate dehydrogenase E1 component beta subunit
MLVLNLVEAVTNALDTAMENDKNVVVYGEDVGVEGGVFRATKGLQKNTAQKDASTASSQRATS